MFKRIDRPAFSYAERLVVVGDTNPARHLYERAGFRVTLTSGVWPFAQRLGFKHFLSYELELGPTVDRSTGEST